MPHAFLLHLTPQTKAAPQRYLSKYAHGFFYHVLAQIDAELSARVHALKRNPFTLWAKAHKDGSVYLRVTTLDDALFQPLIRTVLAESLVGMSLGQDSYQVARVLATPEGHRDAGFTGWDDLLAVGPTGQLDLTFLTPTVFTTSKPDGAKAHYTPLPIPRLMMQSLLSSFQHYSPAPYSEPELLELERDFVQQLIVTRHEVRTQPVVAGKVAFTGFVGRSQMRYQGRSQLVAQALARLGCYAFYAGLGAKTSFGMGQVRVRL
jgi:CRISPR-associated endoribonuclease Cas6